MVEKNRKLQNQFEAEASTSSHGGSGSVKPLFDGVTAKFKCVARVVAALPWQAEDFLSPLGTYRIRLTLEDPTARIHALLYGEDGEKFFGGYPSVDALTRKLSKLLGLTVSDNGKQINYAPRNPPWVQFCLKSYYLSKTEVW